MLCEISAVGENFFLTWAVMTLIGTTSVLSFSGILFYYYYWPTNVTYEKWTRKSNPKFPTPEKVRDEVVQTMKGIVVVILLLILSLWLSARGKSQAYCGVGDHGWGYLVLSFFAIWVGSDFWSFFYHRLGHVFETFWTQHRHHHVFFNPSPFAVIADEPIDQFFRASPLLVFPMLMPVNMDLLFFEFAVFFYAYGVYLHWGYELDSIDAHHPIINSSFQHYCHHAKAILKKPYHCGFYFKIWDQLSGGIYPEDQCFCAKCERAKGNRTREQFKQIEIPNYYQLLKPSFWLRLSTLTGNTSKDKNNLTEEENYFDAKGANKAKLR